MRSCVWSIAFIFEAEAGWVCCGEEKVRRNVGMREVWCAWCALSEHGRTRDHDHCAARLEIIVNNAVDISLAAWLRNNNIHYS